MFNFSFIYVALLINLDYFKIARPAGIQLLVTVPVTVIGNSYRPTDGTGQRNCCGYLLITRVRFVVRVRQKHSSKVNIGEKIINYVILQNGYFWGFL